MSADTDKEIITIVKQLYSTIRKVGVKKVLIALQRLNTSGDSPDNSDIIDLIIRKVSDVYECTIDELKKKNTRGSLYHARNTCYILIYEFTTLSHQQIVQHLDRSNRTEVSHALTFKKKLDVQIKEHADFLAKYEKICSSISKVKTPTTKELTDDHL